MLKLPEIFTDHIVLACGREVTLWGETDRWVEAYLDGERFGAAALGKFEITLPPQPAGGPHTLELRTNAESVTLADVLFGEVWLAGGQSNVEYRLRDDAEYALALQDCELPLVRQFTVPEATYADARRDHPENYRQKPQWSISSKESCQHFSALCWWAARDYTRRTGIPVGILQCFKGGSSICAWVDRRTVHTDPYLKGYVEDYNAQLRGLDLDAAAKLHNDWYAADGEWHRKAQYLIEHEGMEVKAAYSDPRIGQCAPWPPPHGPWHFSSPANLYEGMLTTVIPYTLSRVIYYQGEEDVSHTDRYLGALRAMIALWRRDFRDEGLPFLLVTIAPYAYDWDNCLKTDSALIREADCIAAREIPGVTAVVSTDTGEKYDIHPPYKQTLGLRLSAQLRKPEETSPAAIRRETAADAWQVFFDRPLAPNDAVTGLLGVSESGALRPLPGRAESDRLTVYTGGEPVTELRYCFGDFLQGNLFGTNGLPAEPFRFREA